MNLKEKLIMNNDIEELRERANNTLLFYLGYTSDYSDIKKVALEFINDERETLVKYDSYLKKLIPKLYSVKDPVLKLGFIANQDIRFYKDSSNMSFPNTDLGDWTVYAIPGSYYFNDAKVIVSELGTARLISNNGETKIIPAVTVSKGGGIFISNDLVKDV